MTKIEERKILRYVALSLMPGIGPNTQNRLLEFFGGIDNCFETEWSKVHQAELCELKQKNTGWFPGNKILRFFLENRDSEGIIEHAVIVLQLCKEKRIQIIVREDPLYPDRFRSIPEMPAVLYCKGNLQINDYQSSVGIIGARRCTREGRDMAVLETQEAVENDCAIVSGMAKGIDSYAHTAALKSGGYTVAVLGNGPDICYPKEHQMLYEKITEKGCILSEYRPGTHPRKYSFPRRNRLIAALSDKLIVIDAGNRSGTESTIVACNQYGRKVVCC